MGDMVIGFTILVEKFERTLFQRRYHKREYYGFFKVLNWNLNRQHYQASVNVEIHFTNT